MHNRYTHADACAPHAGGKIHVPACRFVFCAWERVLVMDRGLRCGRTVCGLGSHRCTLHFAYWTVLEGTYIESFILYAKRSDGNGK